MVKCAARQGNEKESLGCELEIQKLANVTDKDLIQQYGVHIVIAYHQLKRARADSSLKLNSLPPNTSEDSVRQTLISKGGPTPKHVYVPRANNNASAWTKVTFANEQDRNNASVIYQLELC
ncbi:unnamed protein product [Didymodactylos carnosus]|uniref:Uncharacterized protein n=1 Tax=Didymodactylos carnosus TaxID=1234261 RepID=A0A8S2L091_9BILA|nr:unnamed protein product [Didymodactylos carnosus]CAF3864011.1 unnamed protein product [Didymodactylos carnosus]